MWLTATVVGGTAIGVVTPVTPGAALAAAVAAAALAPSAPSRRGAAMCLVAALSCAAAAHGAAARAAVLHPPVLAWFDHETGGTERAAPLVTLTGVLVADARVEDAGVRLLVDVDKPARGRVQLHVAGAMGAGRVGEWIAGRRVQAPVTLRRPPLLQNFGGPSPFWQQLRRPFTLAGVVKSASLVGVERGAWAAEAAARARQFSRRMVARYVAPRDPQAAAIVLAILIGDRAGLDDDVVRQLQIAGTYHVIAISGGNIALLTTLSFVLLRLAVRSARVAAGLTLLVTLAYSAVVGGDPSVSRAVTAAACYLGAALAGLVPSPLATVRTVAIMLTIADPLIVCDVGAWLSFGATTGILLIAPRLANVVAAPGLVRPLILLMSATCAAELALAPIAAAVFNRVTLAGLLLNVVAIPAMAIVQIGGLAIVAVGAWFPAAAHALAAAVASAAHAMVASAVLVDHWTWLSWRVPEVPILLIAAYYVTAVLALRASNRSGRRVATVTCAAVLLIIVAAPAVTRRQPQAEHLRISVIDVGQGDAILVQSSFGPALLIDAGGSPGSFDVGGRVVTPAIWALGERRLMWLAVTHGDRDHAGGATAVAQDLDPREIWEGVPVSSVAELARLREWATAHGAAWRTVHAGARLDLGPVRIDAIHPPPPDWERPRVRNDDSLVIRIRYGNFDALLTGDAGAEFERSLPLDLQSSGIRVLKAGHHGSRSSTSAELVQSMRPQVALISVGGGNLFGHPAGDVITRLQAAGTEVFRTDRDGAITVETDGVRAWVLTALGRRLMLVASQAQSP